MSQNYFNNYPNQCYPNSNPNAVSINIFTPQAYGNSSNPANLPVSNNTDGYYSVYGANNMPNLPLYPQNYNAPIYNYANNPVAQNPYQYGYPTPHNPNAAVDTSSQTNLLNNKSLNSNESNNNKLSNEDLKSDSANKSDDNKKNKEKIITPLTDDYIKNLESYLNSPNSKIRLIGIKEVMERFKEDDNRKDNKSLVPLLNKALQDTNSAVRFLALTALQLGYSVGDDTTVKLLTKIANENQDKFGQDALLASEILLKLSAPPAVKVKEGSDQ